MTDFPFLLAQEAPAVECVVPRKPNIGTMVLPKIFLRAL